MWQKMLQTGNGGEDMKEWTFLQSQVGATPITLPTNYSELIVESEVVSGASYSVHVCKAQVQSNKIFYQGCAWIGTVKANAVAVTFASGTVKTEYAFRNGSDLTSSCTTHVYYR